MEFNYNKPEFLIEYFKKVDSKINYDYNKMVF